MNKRTAREIIVKNELINNKQINVRVGTAENRDYPQTVYISTSFWIRPINEIGDRKFLEQSFKNFFNGSLNKFLASNYFFPHNKENIYIYNIPENFNYNNKYNFISIEVYLHTLNIYSENKIPLNAKKNTNLFEECLKISNFVGDELKKLESTFYVKKSSKSNSCITPES